MADDRQPRGERRVGDATQARIDDMAKGWKKSGDDGAPEGAKAKPPPPPGAKPPGAKRPSKPPPLPPKVGTSPARQKRRSSPPLPIPSPEMPGREPKVVVAKPSHPSGPAHARTIPRKQVSSEAKPPLPKPRAPSRPPPIADSPSAASPLPRAEGSPAPVLKPPSEPEVADKDATVVPSGESTALELPPELRAPAALPRRSGLWGDMLYVGTVVFGRRRLRIELAETELEIEAEKRSRDKELTELARLAISEPDLSVEVVEKARERLVQLEEARSRKAGAAVAAEQAIDSILRERDKVKEQREQQVADIEKQIAELEIKLEPLEARRLEIGKRAREVVEQVERYNSRISEEEASLETAALEDAAATEASLAGLRAERDVAARRQPALAAELAEVEPSIRELKAEKGELAKKMSRLRRAEDESVVRSEEKVTAARAHKLVVDRAAADRTRDQNELLRDLGEALYHNPPPAIAALVTPLADRFATLNRLKAKAVDAREKIESVERLPFFRGAGLWLLVLAAIVGIAALILKFV